MDTDDIPQEKEGGGGVTLRYFEAYFMETGISFGRLGLWLVCPFAHFFFKSKKRQAIIEVA